MVYITTPILILLSSEGSSSTPKNKPADTGSGLFPPIFKHPSIGLFHIESIAIALLFSNEG
jgi:hypothetical protein